MAFFGWAQLPSRFTRVSERETLINPCFILYWQVSYLCIQIIHVHLILILTEMFWICLETHGVFSLTDPLWPVKTVPLFHIVKRPLCSSDTAFTVKRPSSLPRSLFCWNWSRYLKSLTEYSPMIQCRLFLVCEGVLFVDPCPCTDSPFRFLRWSEKSENDVLLPSIQVLMAGILNGVRSATEVWQPHLVCVVHKTLVWNRKNSQP